MNQPSLHGVALDVLDNQRRVAKSLLAAVRRGTARAYGGIDRIWEKSLDSGLAGYLSPAMRRTLTSTQKKLSGAATGGVDSATHLIDRGLDAMYDGTARRMHGSAAGKLYGTRVYGTISRATAPLASLTLSLSSDLAGRVERWAGLVGGDTTVATRRKPVRGARAPKKVAAKRGRRAVA